MLRCYSIFEGIFFFSLELVELDLLIVLFVAHIALESIEVLKRLLLALLSF